MDYLTGGFEPPKARRCKLACQIDDNEARAVRRLILDTQGQSEVLDDWLDAKFDVNCGLAALHVRYGVIEFNSN